MASILTNVSAMAALSTLRTIGNQMETTQSHVSSGLRVGSASDNAAYWSIATTMRSDNGALSAVQDAIGLGAAKVDTAYTGMESIISVVKTIKEKLVAATETSADKTKIQGEITQLTDQLKGIVDASSFSGENLLKTSSTTSNAITAQVAGSFVREGSTVSVKMISYAGTALVSGTTTGVNAGLLDKTYNNLAANSIDVKVTGVATTVTTNKGTAGQGAGFTETFTLENFSQQDLIDKGAKFTSTNSSGQMNVAYTATGTQYYVKTDNGWVKGKVDAAATKTQEAAGVLSAANVTALGAGTANDVIIVDTSAAVSTSVTASSSLLSTNIVGMSTSNVQNMIKASDALLADLTSAASTLGSISMRIGLQKDFAAKLSDTLSKGVGRLVDADMNQESTKLKALQTQQQLAIQSLSIANSDSQSILSLFR